MTSSCKYDSIIFDLDGTLWSTSSACADSWNNVLQRNAIPFRKIVADDISRVTGLPHEECIKTTFDGLSESHIKILIEETEREDNLVISRQGGILYPGVKETIPKLSETFKLFIVSNCQEGYIETFLRWSGLASFFTDFECWGNTKRPKANNTAAVITRNNLETPIFVGDTTSDQAAASANDIPFIFMTYGFGRVDACLNKFTSFPEFTDWANSQTL